MLDAGDDEALVFLALGYRCQADTFDSAVAATDFRDGVQGREDGAGRGIEGGVCELFESEW